ncbi:glycosyltransferase family 2 protein [Novosphingobium terrae]|jgi:GT2 family glycosyltransferase|uniref:glycosyltransferase family 2 protein n=1 Tax=Novosphingobium terrae TaxID=2726189 RepID=UPI001982466E|nr:glycosyltransferase [Novosphingobium terrae]
MRIHVIFATTGRAEVLGKVVSRLKDQTRAPDGVIVVGTCPADVAGVEGTFPRLQVIITAKGLCNQRNAGLAALGDQGDVVVFFDDDFVPAHDFLEQVETLMSADESIVGLTGQLVRDGAQTGSLIFEEAVHQLDVLHERPSMGEARTAWLYGCNMVIRLSATPQLRFDEALPLYGWQEDVDFSSRLARHGRLYRTAALTGIHLGVRGGRTSGLRLGYSQIANVIYLRRKGTIRFLHGWRILTCNVAANMLGSLTTNSPVDRRGRLKGNWLAMRDLTSGRIDPRRVLAL